MPTPNPAPGQAPIATPTAAAPTSGVPDVMPDPLDMPRGSVVDPIPAQPFGPSAPGTMPFNAAPVASTPAPTVAPATPAAAPKRPKKNLALIISLVVASVIAVTFIGLFIWKYSEWYAVRTDVDSRIDQAVALAVSENTTKLENDFVERERYPYKTFMGPADYGSLNFEYPKTWNVYIAKDASNGGDFEAYLNPGEVQPVSSTTINALRVTIRDQAFDNVLRTYDNFVRNGKLAVVTRNVGSTVANVYTGELPGGIRGILAAFKLRDKTVLLQTDADIFSVEFYKMLDTVTFVE